jgi:hypothetical protein
MIRARCNEKENIAVSVMQRFQTNTSAVPQVKIVKGPSLSKSYNVGWVRRALEGFRT